MKVFSANELVQVGDAESGGKGLIAQRSIKADEAIFTISGKVVSTQSRYTAPIAKGIFIDPVIDSSHCTEVYYLNHSCKPNAYIKHGGLCVALCDIPHNEEVRVHYGLFGNFGNEWKDRVCLCGENECAGWVKGYSELTEEERLGFAPYIQEWVKTL